jgi:hypothetical protein
MKNLDVVSKRILSAGVALSIVLLSGSLFLFALDNLSVAKADPLHKIEFNRQGADKNLNRQFQDTISTEMDEDIYAIQAFGMGIREGQIYFGILYNNNSIGLHKAEADGEDVLLW